MKEFKVKVPQQNREGTMTSSWRSRQNSESDNPSYSVILDDRKHENTKISHVYPYENDRPTLKPLKDEVKVGEAKFKYPESLNYDVMEDDGILN